MQIQDFQSPKIALEQSRKSNYSIYFYWLIIRNRIKIKIINITLYVRNYKDYIIVIIAKIIQEYHKYVWSHNMIIYILLLLLLLSLLNIIIINLLLFLSSSSSPSPSSSSPSSSSYHNHFYCYYYYNSIYIYRGFLKWWYPRHFPFIDGFPIINHPFWGTPIYGTPLQDGAPQL